MKINEEDILTIFGFWNEYRGKDSWKSHIKLSDDLLLAIVDTLKKYEVEEVCQAIDNYATVLLDDNYWWTHTWSLTTFLTVKNGTFKDASLKWLRFHPDNFVLENYLKSKGSPEDVREVEPEFIEELIRKFGKLIGNSDYKPDRSNRNHFAGCANKLRELIENKRYNKKALVEAFFDFLESEFIDNSKILYPANLNSKTAIEVMFPQYLKDIGIM
jgi:hypothetical protein